MKKIKEYLKRIYSIHELEAEATSKDFLEVRFEGCRVNSINSIIYTLMPPLKENRTPIGFHP